MMKCDGGSCEPEQLAKLQNIFDRLWVGLRNGTGSFTDPLDSDALRDEIARRVLEFSADPNVTAAQITEAVMVSFGMIPPERTKL